MRRKRFGAAIGGANKVSIIAIGSGALALVAIVIFGLLFWQKREENALNLAANFREMGVSELASNNPLAAELLFARAIGINDTPRARERLIEARAKSPRLLWIGPSTPRSSIIAISPLGADFAVRMPSGMVELWSVKHRERRGTIPANGTIQSAAFSRDGNLLALGVGSDIQVWDAAGGATKATIIFRASSEISSLAFSPHGRTLFSGTAAGIIAAWDMGTLRELPVEQFSGHSDRVTAVTVSADGGTLISGSWDETIRIWDLLKGSDQRKLGTHDDAVLCVAISPDGQLIASAGWEDTIWISDRTTGRPLRALIGHKGSILSLAFSPDGQWLVSSSEDHTARLWEVERGKHVLTFPGHANDISNVAFLDSEAGYRVLTGDTGGVVRLWDLDLIGQRDELVTFRAHTGSITMFAFNPVKPLLASSSVDKTVRIWNMQTKRSIGLFGDRKDKISSVTFSPDGLYLASASKGSRIEVWQVGSGEAMTLRDEKESGRVRHVAFSPNGKLLVGGSDDGQIRIWDFNEGKLLQTFPAHTAKIQGLAFNQDGTILATSSEDTKIKLWQTTDWHLSRELIGHTGGVYEIGFSPDSKYLISASDDRTARIWSVASGKEVIKPLQHEGPVWAADFDVEGKAIATGDELATVQTWRFIGDDNNVKIDRHRVLRVSDGPVWWIKFWRAGNENLLGLCGEDRNVRIINLTRLERLFANPEQLQHEAEEQSGLQLDITASGPTLSPLTDWHTIAVPRN